MTSTISGDGAEQEASGAMCGGRVHAAIAPSTDHPIAVASAPQRRSKREEGADDAPRLS
jgi:hypothetical protein